MSDLALVRFYQLVLSEALVVDEATYTRMEASALQQDIERAVAKAVQEELDRKLFAEVLGV